LESAKHVVLCSIAAIAIVVGSRVQISADTIASSAVAVPESPELLFKLAKGAWNARTEAPFVTYNLRERYSWRGHIHDNWWTAYYRASDHNLVLHRMLVAQDEARRLRGFPIAFNMHLHKSDVRATDVDTSADADAFPILDPLIAPADSFGLLAHAPQAALVERAPVPAQTISPEPAAPEPDGPLRVVAHVEASSRDYAIAFVGTDAIDNADTYHLALTPLHDPQKYRLRDLWIDPETYSTKRLTVQGLFAGKPYDGALWTVDYIFLAGRSYLRDIRATQPLHFGMDRSVGDLEYDFVGYDFPPTIDDLTFRRLL
jgi:hypothetical protein